MSDILADYREWRSQQEERIGTHSPECHRWHDRCMIHRLAAEVELLDAAHKASNSALLVIDSGFKNALAEIDRLRLAIRRLAGQDATLSVAGGSVTVEMDATLTPEEREAVERAATWMVQLAKDRGDIHTAWYLCDDAATLRGLLERMK